MTTLKRKTNGQSCYNDVNNNQFVFRLKDIKAWVDENDPHATIIPFSGAFEQKVG